MASVYTVSIPNRKPPTPFAIVHASGQSTQVLVLGARWRLSATTPAAYWPTTITPVFLPPCRRRGRSRRRSADTDKERRELRYGSVELGAARSVCWSPPRVRRVATSASERAGLLCDDAVAYTARERRVSGCISLFDIWWPCDRRQRHCSRVPVQEELELEIREILR